MEAKKEFVSHVANHLIGTKVKMYAQDLVDELNTHGHLTRNKTPFKRGRGIYKLIDATYDNLVDEMRQPEADDIANAFVDVHGLPAWRNKP